MKSRTAFLTGFGWVPLCLAAGIISVALGQDASWDLQNYHLYNAFALLHPHRHDFAIAQIQSFLNPVLDVPLYLLTVMFAHAPRMVAFCMGLPYGVLAFFGLRIAFRLFGRQDNAAAAVIAALFGLTGTATASQIGLSTNEIPVAALVLAGFDFLLVAVSRDEFALPPFMLAGLLTGLATGGKLTAAPYAVGLAFAALAALPPRRWAVSLIGLGAFGVVGVALTGGFWMAHLAATYGNPIFPYDNQIFRSPWAGPWPYVYVRFFPRGAWQTLFYPFWWARLNDTVVTEAPFADPRLAAVFAIAALSLAALLVRRLAIRPPPAWRAVLVFWLVSYALWEKLFSIYRYTIPLEIIGGMIFVGAIRALLPARQRLATAVASCLVAMLALTSTYPNWGRIAFQRDAVPVTLPALPARSLVVSTTRWDAVSFLALRAPKDTVFIGAETNFVFPDTAISWRRTSTAIADWRGPIEIVEPLRGDAVARDVAAAQFNLVASDQCQTIKAAWNGNSLHLCAANLLAGAPGYQPAISFGFAAGDVSTKYTSDGWAQPENWGTWSIGPDSTILLPVNPANTRPLQLTVLAYGLPSTTAMARHADVYANGRLIAHWALLGGQATNYQAIIPSLGGASQLTLRFHILDPATENEQTALGETRALGIAMMRLSVQEILADGK